MARSDFTLKTKRIVSERAGFRCSYPPCGKLTSGPGARGSESSNTGTAAHIYSAASGGPRGQGTLTEKELKSADNAIWLCRDHGTTIDNNRGEKYPPHLLLSYKQMHEARIAHEHQGLYSPLGWVHKLRISRSPIFENNSSFSLSKLNLIIGNNATGKSAICEWISGLFDSRCLDRWIESTDPINLDITYFNPQENEISIEMHNGMGIYRVNNELSPPCPIKLSVVSLRDEGYRITEDEKNNDFIFLSNLLKVDSYLLDHLINLANNYKHSKVNNLKFIEEDGLTRLHCDVDRAHPGLPFSSLSGREKERVHIELLCAHARLCSKFGPALLIIDGTVNIFFEGWFEYYSHHFLDPDNQFQTIMTIPSRDIDLSNIIWNGWQVIRTSGNQPGCTVTQEGQNA